MRKILRIITVIVLFILLIMFLFSLYSTYDALARNAIIDADLMPNIILTGFILFGFVFNLSKILPSQYYVKSIHKFLRITDLIILPFNCTTF